VLFFGLFFRCPPLEIFLPTPMIGGYINNYILYNIYIELISFQLIIFRSKLRHNECDNKY